MDTRSTRCRPWGWLAVLAVMLAAVPAAAQPGDYGLRVDSLGLAADAVPLPAQRAWTVDCGPSRLAVVRDSTDMRGFRHRTGCEPSAFPELGRDLYVHVLMGGDCHARFGVEAYRSASRREYRVVMVTRFGRCRSGKSESRWVRLPLLPDGWTVAFTDRRLDPDEDAADTDSRGAAPDAVPLAIEREEVDCRVPEFSMVRDSADVRHLQRFVGCEASAFPALGRHLYVHVPGGGFCGGRYTVRAYRSDTRREVRVVRMSLSRACGGARQEPEWYRLPPLPDGWTVAFTDTAA
jgi:hypothetical protein